MRIGDIKNKIEKVINDNHVIYLDSESMFGGQAYKINNYLDVIDILYFLSKQEWNKVDFSEVGNLIEKYGKNSDAPIIEAGDFDQLSSYINSINPQIPLYYSFLVSFAETQDEKTINVKLPRGINSLNDLSIFNERLREVFLLFNVDGQFEFKGFDKGTEWYVMVAGGVLSYKFVLACLKITQEYFKMRTEYFKSEEARISYEASLNGKKFTESGFNSYQEEWLKIFISDSVKKAIDALGMNGQTKEELHSQLVKATTKLVKELDVGTEFHLSLNPPKYAREDRGSLQIDYKSMKQSQKIDEVKRLDSPQNEK